MQGAAGAGRAPRSRSRRGSRCCPCRGGEAFLRRLFEPLGYDGRRPCATRWTSSFPAWGDEPVLHGDAARRRCRLRDLLTHLYVLIPVLDDDKHYWVGDDEVEKLLRHGEGWLGRAPGARADRRPLPEAPARPRARRRSRGSCEEEPADADDERRGARRPRRRRVEERHQPERAAARRRGRGAASESGATRVLDLGCGEGKLLARAARRTGSSSEIVGMDVSHRALEIAARPPAARPAAAERSASAIQLLHGSLIYRDERLAGFDAAARGRGHRAPRPAAARAPSSASLFEYARPGDGRR